MLAFCSSERYPVPVKGVRKAHLYVREDWSLKEVSNDCVEVPRVRTFLLFFPYKKLETSKTIREIENNSSQVVTFLLQK